jgi:co-chaperonin GroES (HSP10)
MKISRPLGARVIVEDIITTLSIEQRAQNAGFIAIVNEDNRPKSTQGKVIAVGTDPLMQEEVHVGDVVSFSYLSGTRLYIESVEYRSLEFNEIIMVTREEQTYEEDLGASIPSGMEQFNDRAGIPEGYQPTTVKAFSEGDTEPDDPSYPAA